MIVKIIGILLFSLAGAFDIWAAVQIFINGKYFLFGFSVMIAICMAAGIFQIVLED